MTTIAYDHENQLIAIDSRRCRGDAITSDNAVKFKAFSDGSIWFFCGVTADFKLLVHAYENGTRGIEREIEGEAILFSKELGLRRVYFADGETHYDDDYTYSLALGSGSPYALAAMDFGKDAAEAVEYAKTRDNQTGGKVHVYSIKTSCFVTERWRRE